jgi:hypothetical protein
MLIGQKSPRRSPSGPVRGALAAAVSLALLAVPAVAFAPAAPAAEELPSNERAPRPAPPEPSDNQRAPRVPNPPDLGDTPWTTDAGKDMKGYRLSTYTGKYYDPAREQYRICVIQRESGGNYDEPSGPWRGAYQFSDTLAAGALRAMRAEIVAVYGNAGRQALDALEGTLIYTWPRFFQDAAFWTTFNKGAGAGHWAGGSWYCNPARNAESGWPNPNRWNYSPLERSASTRSAAADTVATRSSPERNMRLARNFIRDEYGWGPRQFQALKDMWWKESNWRHTVINWHPNGPWYGLGQVNGGFIASRGYSIKEYMASPLAQIDVGAAYIKQRYGSPVKAWSFWLGNGWY